MFKKNIDILIIILNIIFFSYYAIQLLIFTDEFAIRNLGFFNHAVAGLAEIIGTMFLTFIIALIFITYLGIEKQFPLIFSIFIFQFLASINFWRYVITDSPGETTILAIQLNAILFSLLCCINFFFLIKNFKILID